MNLKSIKINTFVIVLFLFSQFIAFHSCLNAQTINVKSSRKIVQAKLKSVSRIEHGKLEIAGSDEDKFHVLTVWGTPYEMGKAYGTLFKKEIEHLQNMLVMMLSKGGQSIELLDQLYEQAKPYISDYLMEEMQGLADGSQLSLQSIIRINLLGEAAEFH